MIVSHELSMIQMNDPLRTELANNIEAFLSLGGAIQELPPFTYVPPPIRHEPEARKQTKPRRRAIETNKVDKLTQRDLDRETRAKEKADLIDKIRALAPTMTQSEAQEFTGINRRKLQTLAKDNGFTFKPSARSGHANLRRCTVDEAKDAKAAERIKASREIGLTRNQAMEKAGISFTAFTRILEKFEIDYPKSGRRGPRPAFFAKTKEVSHEA